MHRKFERSRTHGKHSVNGLFLAQGVLHRPPRAGSPQNCTKAHTPLLFWGRLSTELGFSAEKARSGCPVIWLLWPQGLCRACTQSTVKGHWGFCSPNGKGRPRSECRIPLARPRDVHSTLGERRDQTNPWGASSVPTGGGGPGAKGP